jgi:cytoskeletal protein CcmA (bactofilin family)
MEASVSLFGTRKDEIAGFPAESPPEPAPQPAARPAASGGGKTLFGRGEDAMANIGKSITIKGDLSGNEDIVVEGTVEGKVELPNNQLTIGANGTARAEITAKTIVVIGRVSGNVHGTERVEIQATGVVEGDVSAPRLIVSEGAVLNGSIHMTQKGAAAAGAHEAPRALLGEVRKTAQAG